IATTRPEASETTGTLRATSGVTVPVTTNSELEGRSTAVSSGNCSGRSTVNSAGSAPSMMFAGGGASAAGSACAVQPANVNSKDRQTTALSTLLLFMGKSLCRKILLPDG